VVEEDEEQDVGAGVEMSVPSSVSFLTMPWRTAVARCASTAVSVGGLGLLLLDSGSIDPAAVGLGKATSICPPVRDSMWVNVGELAGMCN
jgi:hypothetical protein